MLTIRKYIPSDGEYLTELFYQTVHSVNAKDYTAEQLNAWATSSVDLGRWNQSLSEHDTIVAVKDQIIVGFGDMDERGYLDRLYVHKNYQRQGIATAICNELERGSGVNKVTTHASITAKPFFLSRGYKIIKEQQVIRNGVSLTNYIMEKSLKNRTKDRVQIQRTADKLIYRQRYSPKLVQLKPGTLSCLRKCKRLGMLDLSYTGLKDLRDLAFCRAWNLSLNGNPDLEGLEVLSTMKRLCCLCLDTQTARRYDIKALAPKLIEHVELGGISLYVWPEKYY